jgi:drug/metabolite transporter (DMT)-like permease
MPRKDQMDAFGATSLVLFSALFGFNQVVVKVVNGGFEPVFAAGLRSLGAIPLILLWASLRGRSLRILPGTVPGGLILGACFTVEFLLLFTALDLTTVSRMSVIFYSMPIWLSLGAHVLIPGERLSRRKALGLALAFGGVAWAILDRPAGRDRLRSRAISARSARRSAGRRSGSRCAPRASARRTPRRSSSGSSCPPPSS